MITAERTIAPSCVNPSASSAEKTTTVLGQSHGEFQQSASVGQNNAWAIHISVGAPYTKGQRQRATDKHK